MPFITQINGYHDFVIGVNNLGNKVLNTCDHKKLANNFGANKGFVHYLTEVSFKTEVLDKYRNRPSIYDVEPGVLRCKNNNGDIVWSLPIDNEKDNVVNAWLGDLGKELPYAEQLHFGSYNIPPSGMGNAFVRGQTMGEFCDSTNPIDCFIREYDNLRVESMRVLGWDLLLALTDEDEHYIKALKLLTHGEQKEFDEQILSLSKILNDSLNVEKLKAFATSQTIVGSINILEEVMKNQGFTGYSTHISCLREIQAIRSASTAHRKGENYSKIIAKYNIDKTNLCEYFRDLVTRARKFCTYAKNNINLLR